MKIGEKILLKGPEGTIAYIGNRQFSVNGQYFYCDKLNFIVGGTGITPALAILRAIVLSEKRSDTTLCLVYANKAFGFISIRRRLK